jgi:hypothetical protein
MGQMVRCAQEKDRKMASLRPGGRGPTLDPGRSVRCPREAFSMSRELGKN